MTSNAYIFSYIASSITRKETEYCKDTGRTGMTRWAVIGLPTMLTPETHTWERWRYDQIPHMPCDSNGHFIPPTNGDHVLKEHDVIDLDVVDVSQSQPY
ncbi:hypothetical protein J6590_003529 [Homalodisca vitripennis]|nr:hypothetical protein J6590_003529 [Homalodisca vitripennis]